MTSPGVSCGLSPILSRFMQESQVTPLSPCKETTMKKMILTLAALCAFGMAGAHAADAMSQDGMKKQDDSTMMKKKTPMKHDGMAKKESTMKHGDKAKKGTMGKDEDMMKKKSDGMGE